MPNLRISSVIAEDTSTIIASFTDSLSTNIGASNISIEAQLINVPSPEILEVSVLNNTLKIITQPLTSLATYYITFQSTDNVLFQSLNATSLLLEDGVANKQFFVGPVEDTNVVKQYFLDYLRSNVYDTSPGTNLSAFLDSLSTILSKALYDVRQVKNENYLSLTITDEVKTRGPGAFDHLDEECAYEIIRVGKTPTDAVSPFTITIDEFSDDPISLLTKNATENLTANSVDIAGSFNINSLILNLPNRFVISLNSLTIRYNTGHLDYIYNIDPYGYQILDGKYDSDYAFTYDLLSDNQIKLSDKILEDPNFSSNGIFQVIVNYNYKDTGRVIDPTSVSLTSVLPSGREVLPPIVNIFNLNRAPVVDANNNIGQIGDITFVDQNSLTVLNKPHPAFLNELVFRLDYLPSAPGDYAVDYATGTVYVSGADTTMDGTGPTPPLAIYNYRQTFQENLDWVLDEDSNDLVALLTGQLIGNGADIDFNFEQVLAQGIDYNPLIHQEALEERIGNNLVALNAFVVQNAPITNVFRIFNETSGEIYKVIRWNDSKVFFSYNKPPVIEEITNERASFDTINNELLFINNIIPVSTLLQIFQLKLNNNNIIAASEDCLGSSFNTTLSPSDSSIFTTELYFDPGLTQAVNLSRLTSLGQYQVDYANGLIYVLVSTAQDSNLGTVSYKRGYIIPQFPHITSIADIYYQIDAFTAKNKHFDYTSFTDGSILPSSFDQADEQYLNGDKTLPYLLVDGQIGVFENTDFFNIVSNDILFLRGIYENEDLLNNPSPLNFAPVSPFTGRSITVNSLSYSEYHTVQYDGTHYYILVNTPLLYISPNITFSATITRLIDNAQLWNSSGTLVPGNMLKLVLPGINSPAVGNSVLVSYGYTINDLSHVIIDYNKGEYYIDYDALTDEIIVSYEYGSNALDFRQSNALNEGDQYYVSYKVGALRDALLKNFGSLIDIDQLNNFDITYSRERYRDAITAAMHAFSQGPTVPAIESLAQIISHLPAKIDEEAFDSWVLGINSLQPDEYKLTGQFQLSQAKYDNGINIDQPGQMISLPAISNFKLEEGTFETWIKPEWDGIDNFASLNINITKDGYVLPNLNVFIGALEYHPTYTNNSFCLTKFDNVNGIPNKNKNGVFIYYGDSYEGFNKWFVDVIDNAYTGGATSKYVISINCGDGKIYDVMPNLAASFPASTKTTTSTNNIVFTATNNTVQQGISFVSDIPHFILDVADDEKTNRLSIFKDETGYLVLKVYDKFHNSYIISDNVSNWLHEDLHHIAASWQIDGALGRDELHLFIDGFEVANIIKYGSKNPPNVNQNYRTISEEEISSNITHNIVAGTDLTTTFGSNQVRATENFSAYGIQIGDIIYIEEPNFNLNGYNITNINGNTLTLNSSMPQSITNGTYSINKTSFYVNTEIEIYPNLAVSLISTFAGATDGYVLNNTLSSSSSNFITLGVVPGDFIKIAGYADHFTIISVATHILTINSSLPTHSSTTFYLYHPSDEMEIPGPRATIPAYSVSYLNVSNSSSAQIFNTPNQSVITIRDKAQINDMVLIKTLGLNHRRVRRKYYVWGSSSNILKTRLPIPTSLDEVNIYKVILPTTLIGPANSTLSGGIFTSTLSADQPSNSITGRTLAVSIQGLNIDFSTPTSVSIYGTTVNAGDAYSSGSETLTFTAAGIQDTVHYFNSISSIVVSCKPIDSTKTSAILEIKEAESINIAQNYQYIGGDKRPLPVIAYSYQVGVGNHLDGYGDGYTVSDPNNFFSDSLVGSYLLIYSPGSAAGSYLIDGVSKDHTSLYLQNYAGTLPLPYFADGYYQILSPATTRNGLQNGYFTFQDYYNPGSPYNLPQGWYELDYYTYLTIPFDLKPTMNINIGSDFTGKYQFGGTIDDLHILDTMLTDTRIGETVPSNTRTITKDFNSVKAVGKDMNTLVLTTFDSLPPTNDADIYQIADKSVIQSGEAINDNFGKSMAFIQKPMIIENNGILDTRKEGTIEFWVNSIFDTANDPNPRYYFDASGNVSENVVSTNNLAINLIGSADSIQFVHVVNGDDSIDYFAGGELSTDGKTLYLHRELPDQNTNVIVGYTPKGLNGDRISIFKDQFGYLNFLINANEISYVVRAPVFWARGTWHRVKASYKFNSGSLNDEIHLLIDGYEQGNVLFGSGLIFDQGVVYGSSFAGNNNNKYSIKFSDPVNQVFIGSDVNGGNLGNCLMDNFRISNIMRPIYQPFGESLDPNYSSNQEMIFPITSDLNTTLLLDFETMVQEITEFALLNDKNSGLTDFSIQISDSFDIIKSSATTKSVLEELINNFKPANSRCFIQYLD